MHFSFVFGIALHCALVAFADWGGWGRGCWWWSLLCVRSRYVVRTHTHAWGALWMLALLCFAWLGGWGRGRGVTQKKRTGGEGGLLLLHSRVYVCLVFVGWWRNDLVDCLYGALEMDVSCSAGGYPAGWLQKRWWCEGEDALYIHSVSRRTLKLY